MRMSPLAPASTPLLLLLLSTLSLSSHAFSVHSLFPRQNNPSPMDAFIAGAPLTCFTPNVTYNPVSERTDIVSACGSAVQAVCTADQAMQASRYTPSLAYKCTAQIVPPLTGNDAKARVSPGCDTAGFDILQNLGSYCVQTHSGRGAMWNLEGTESVFWINQSNPDIWGYRVWVNEVPKP